MTADVRFWLYLGFFLYTVYCLFTIDPDESDDGGSVGQLESEIMAFP